MTNYLLTILITAVVTYLLTVLIRQFTAREKRIEHQVEHLYGARSPQFQRAMGELLPPPIVGGNCVTPLINGREIFPAMLNAIRSARQTVNFETYIYWSGKVAEEFAEALSERARAGVAVQVLLDWVGSKRMHQRLLEKMQDAGVKLARYHKPRWHALGRFNERTHRKLLIVDGQVAFTGGVGVADEWAGDAEDPQHWRDSHYRVEGPAVAQFQAVFMDNWLKTHSTVLHDEHYFPPLQPAGDSPCQVFMSSAAGGSESVRLMYLLALAAAQEQILIANAYFVPDDLSIRMLIAARKRGVDVQVIVPGPYIDELVVRWASRRSWGPLLAAGVQIYEYQPTMYHVKLMIVDGCWVSVGSSNFDPRSFRLNDEVNLNVFDERLAAHEAEQFAADRQRCRRIRLEDWRNRPVKARAKERVSDLVRSQI